MAKKTLTLEEIDQLEFDINNSDDLERHEFRKGKYVDIVRIESKSSGKKLKKNYKYEGNGTNKKLKEIKKEEDI
jgi:hypothetical protein